MTRAPRSQRSGREHPSQPNVVVVLADDLGWGDLGCYGADRIATPNIDRLAREGTSAMDAHASSSVCTPSRYSILTGRYAWRSPLEYGVLGPHGPAIIEPSRPTMASVLKASGYRTGAFGKWHLGLGWKRKDGTRATAFGPGADESILWDGMKPSTDTGEQIDYAEPFTGGPLELGFDRFFGTAGSLDMPPYCFLDQDRTLGVPDAPKPAYAPGQRFGLSVPEWRDDAVDIEVTERAIQWMKTVADQRFFLYLATAAPHRPCVPPDFARGRSSAGPRGDMVFVVDWVVGRIMDSLRELHADRDTLVIFTSDNGALTLHPEDGHPAHSPNGPWRGQKADAWEGGHREPLILRWPGGLPAGRMVSEPVCLTDLLPTVAALADARLPGGSAEDGQDIREMLAGRARRRSSDRVIVHHSANGSFGVRRGHDKAVFASGSGGFSEPAGERAYPPSGRGQLYDLAADPAEQVNLWDAEPAIVADLYGELRRIAGSRGGD